MFIINGKYTQAKFFASQYEEKSIKQITDICNQEFLENCPVSIMPDTHVGEGVSIGTVIQLNNKKVKAEYVGCDVGCGVLAVRIDAHDIDFKKLDTFINEKIPSGPEINDIEKHTFEKKEDMYCWKYIKHPQLINKYLMSLGGGNHFIEMNIDTNGDYWLVVHTGSRNLGIQIEKYYRNLAYKNQNGYRKERDDMINLKIKEYHKLGRREEIGTMIKEELLKNPEHIYSTYQCYLYDEFFDMYIHDMKIVQNFASLNRQYILETIIKYMGWKTEDMIESVHNYIDTDNLILRKGAISAQMGEKVIIPLNMADGSIIGIGKGSEEHLFSAPHGAGRKMSRGDAKDTLSMKEFEERMSDIYSTSVGISTLDESPMAYKDADMILSDIKDTVDIQLKLKPVYNFKAH